MRNIMNDKIENNEKYSLRKNVHKTIETYLVPS